MKFSLDQASFMREIALLQGVIEKKSTFPILHHVLLTATEEGRVTMVATEDFSVGSHQEDFNAAWTNNNQEMLFLLEID